MIPKGSNGKVWGEILDGVYTTYRKRDVHLCFKYNAYGIQKDLFEILKANKCRFVHISEDGQRVFESNLGAWEKHGIRDVLRREDGEQIFLPFKYMRVIKDDKSISLDRWNE